MQIMSFRHILFVSRHANGKFCRPDQIPVALSQKFQQTLVNSVAQQDRILHMAARKVVARMSAFAENAATPGLRVALAVALQSRGGGSFDRQTRTKTVSQLLQVRLSLLQNVCNLNPISSLMNCHLRNSLNLSKTGSGVGYASI